MSATLEQIDAAIREHIADEHPGQLVIGWAIVAATTTDDDGANQYDTIAPDCQPAHHTIGLYRLGQVLVVEGGGDE